MLQVNETCTFSVIQSLYEYIFRIEHFEFLFPKREFLSYLGQAASKLGMGLSPTLLFEDITVYSEPDTPSALMELKKSKQLPHVRANVG